MEPMEKTDNLDRSSTGTNNTAMDGGLDSSVTDQYLTFIVAEEEYGVDILCDDTAAPAQSTGFDEVKYHANIYVQYVVASESK